MTEKTIRVEGIDLAELYGSADAHIERIKSKFPKLKVVARGSSIKAIGEGRVWDGKTALKIGLVDELGGLDATVEALAKRMNYRKYQVVVYPDVEKSFWDVIAEMPTQVKANALREELGEYYPVYMELKRIQNLEPVQARMMPMTLQ